MFDVLFDFGRFRHHVSNLKPSLAGCSEWGSFVPVYPLANWERRVSSSIVRVRQVWVHFVRNFLKGHLISRASLADSQSRNLESAHSQAQANLCRTSTSELPSVRPTRVITEPDSLSPFLGIIDMPTKSCGGNVRNTWVLTVTPSSGGHTVMTCDIIVDYSSDWNFPSLGSANEWIRFNFKEKRVRPNGYSIRADTVRWIRLKSWVIEGSNDCVD
jgi:hypothetical protein